MMFCVSYKSNEASKMLWNPSCIDKVVSFSGVKFIWIYVSVMNELVAVKQ